MTNHEQALGNSSFEGGSDRLARRAVGVLSALGRLDPRPRIDPPRVKAMTGNGAQLLKIDELGPAIPLAQGMHIIHIADDSTHLRSKLVDPGALEVTCRDDAAVKVGDAVADVLAEHELRAALGDFNRADLADPIVDVLKEVEMNVLQMRQVELTGRRALRSAIGNGKSLQLFQCCGVFDAELVPKTL